MKNVFHGRIILFLFLLTPLWLTAQNLLSKNLSLQVREQRLDNVLEIISNKGDFYFSYSSAIVKKDSLVSLAVSGKTVKEILQLLFNDTYEFRESGNYIIIRKAPIRMTMVTRVAEKEDRIYTVSGFVYNENSGVAIPDASVYEKKLLAATLTGPEGYFKIRLKSSKASAVELSVSKEFYLDTMVKIEPRHNQEVTITMIPVDNTENDVTVSPLDILIPDSLKTNPVVNTMQPANDTGKVEGTGLGRFLLSAGLKRQTNNLKKFFTERPFQISFTPGLSTHGKLSSQVINKFSINVLGGYTAGTKGVEIGGLFNIDKKDVQFFQASGLFNIVGGRVNGMQAAGINNTVLSSAKAFQSAGISNFVKGTFTGLQVAGIYNHVTDSMRGLQAAGIGNFAREKVKGVQVAGICNFSNKQVEGAQVSGVINYAKKLKGFQFGLINIVDSSEGYSIGLINIVLKGYHKLSFTTNEVTGINAAFKTGNSKFYSILQAGMGPDDKNKLYSFGYGLGSELPVNKKKNISLNPELISLYLYAGNWDYFNLLNRFQMNINIKINRFISIFGGPACNVFISDQTAGVTGYKFPVPPSSFNTYKFSERTKGWFGWNAGINFF